MCQNMDEMDPPSNFSYEMGRTWATVQIASQDFLYKQEGLCPPFCIWNHFVVDSFQIMHFHFVVVYVELVEASNIKSQ